MVAPDSGYTAIDHTDDPTRYIRRLDEMAADPFWAAVKAETYVLLDPRPGVRLLDLGCGTGDDVCFLSRSVGPHGRVVGVDVSGTMVAEARRRAQAADVPASFCQGDAQALSFVDGAFDATRAERLLQQLGDPRQALDEMVRVIRPGGRVVVIEPDYGTLAIDGADARVTRLLINHRAAHFRSGKVGRKLAPWCKELGVRSLTVKMMTHRQTTYLSDTEVALREKYVDPARAQGIVTVVEADRWLAQLREAAGKGRFRHAITLFLVAGRTPG